MGRNNNLGNYNPNTGTLDDSKNYIESFSSYSGSDIRAVLGGVEIGEIQQVSWSVMREKGGTFVLGDENARSFSRGRRYIAGSFMFGFFSKEALLEGMRVAMAAAPDVRAGEYHEWKDAGPNITSAGGMSVDLNPPGMVALDPRLQDSQRAGEATLRAAANTNPRGMKTIRYADQILPFNITVTAANEYGQHAKMAILGIEIMNMESGAAIETLQMDHRYTFLAREIVPWVKGGTAGGSTGGGIGGRNGNALGNIVSASLDLVRGNAQVKMALNSFFGGR